MAVNFEEVFVQELKARGVEFEISGDGTYKVKARGRELIVNTDNIQSEFMRDRDATAIGRFVESVISADVQAPEWQSAKPHLFPMIESINVHLGPKTISSGLTDRTKVVLALHVPGSGSLRFVTESDLAKWGISESDAWETAHASFGIVVSKTQVEILKAGDLALGTVHAHEPYKASMILSKHIKQLVPKELGWPVLAVAPARDFVYLLRKDDESALGRVGAVVVREFKQSGYPVSTEVWELSDSGARALGEFPVE